MNPLEPDPYDELPAVIEIPPTVPPHPHKMEQSFYANFYDNFAASRETAEPSNGSPHSLHPSTSPRPTSPRKEDEEGPSKSVSFSEAPSMNTSSPFVNNKNNQASLFEIDIK